jgi:hypothetical protein
VEFEPIFPNPSGGTMEVHGVMELVHPRVRLSSTIEVEVVPPRIPMESTPEFLPLEGGSVEIHALVTDLGGDPQLGVPVTFESRAGEMMSGGTPVLTGSDGVAVDVLTAAETTVVITRSGRLSGSLEVHLGPRIGHFFFNGGPTQGYAPLDVHLVATLIDNHGQRIPDYPVEVTVLGDDGALVIPDTARTDAHGFATFDVVGITQDGATIWATAGDALPRAVVIRIHSAP